MKSILEKMTQKSQEAFQEAFILAQNKKNPSVEPEHLIQKILEQPEGIVPQILESSSDFSLPDLKERLNEVIERFPKVNGGSPPALSGKLESLLLSAKKECEALGDSYISTEHLFLGVFKSGGQIATLFNRLQITKETFLATLKSLKGEKKVTDPHPENKWNVLKKYTRDLTEMAEQGLLDPVIGRDAEIRRVMQILSRRTKNNPVLIGEPGVGKTAIAEGLALRIVKKDVPEALLGRKLLSLDLAALVAGSKYRGEFEDRLKTLISEITSSDGGILLFIDELHNLVGAGKTDGAMDASQILKPTLARGELRTIGATTLDEYRKFIEKDKALERRFQVLLVQEPGIEDAITILRGLKDRYEVHHGVRIKDQALVTAVKLSHRYITERFLPDKAIDLVDEAASRLSIEINSVPNIIDEKQRKIIQLQVEQKALLKEKDEASKKRLKEIQILLENLEEENKKLRIQWEKEKSSITDLKSLKQKIESVKLDIERAEREGELEKAAELKYGRLPELSNELKKCELEAKNKSVKKALLKEEVGPEEIADVVSQWTGIPVNKMLKTEAEKLLNMETHLKSHVVGQNEALSLISNGVRRARAEISDPDRPMGSFMFLGPTGVGKTETAKALAEFLFDSKDNLIRIDMSEYMEKHSVARLIGAPPGYVGYDEGGQLTEKIRRRPYSVVLMDEIEKAHPDVFHTLLQVLDDGRLTDGQGRTVDFRNTLLIMTSNLGSDVLTNQSIEAKKKEEAVMERLKNHFRPEFLNRVDEIILFHSLSKETLSHIVTIQMNQVKERLKNKNIEITLDKKALNYLEKKGFDPLYGARPIKRAIQKYVLDPLAQKIIQREIGPKDHVLVTGNDLGLKLVKQ